MQCPSCGDKLIVEDLGDGKKRKKCGKCGLSEIVDSQGRKLLTGDAGPPAGVQILLG